MNRRTRGTLLVLLVALVPGRFARGDEESTAGLAGRLDEGRKFFAYATSEMRMEKLEHAASLFGDGANRFPDMKGQFCYGLAACYAQMGRPGLGCEWLEKAVEAGYWNLDAIQKDPDLKKIRKQKRYADALERMRAGIAKARETHPAVTKFGPKVSSPRAVLVMVHAEGGSADEIMEMVGGDAAAAGIAYAAIEGPVLVGKHIRGWASREDTFRRIKSATQLARREFKAGKAPVLLCGHLDGGEAVLQFLLTYPRDLDGAFAIEPVLSEYVLLMAEAGVSAPPAMIVEIGQSEKEIHNQRRRYFEMLRKNNRMARLLGTPTLAMALPGTFRWLLSPNAGG